MNKLEAIRKSIEIWNQNPKDMQDKIRIAEEYGGFRNGCPLCESTQGDCMLCPYKQEFRSCMHKESPYYKWEKSKTAEERDKHSRDFLAQLLYLEHKYEQEEKKLKKEDITIIDYLRPDPKFKVGDKVVYKKEPESSEIREVNWVKDHWAYKFHGNKWFLDEQSLILAPVEPEWVDVTEECELKWYKSAQEGHYFVIIIEYKGERIGELAANKFRQSSSSHFKVEISSKVTGVGSEWFKILKRREE